MPDPAPFRVFFVAGSTLVVTAPNPDQARKAAKSKHDAPISKVKRVKEDA